MILKKLQSIEKTINSELSSKIHNSLIERDELKVEIDENYLIDVVQFIKSNENCKFRQLIDIAGVDYPEEEKRFELQNNEGVQYRNDLKTRVTNLEDLLESSGKEKDILRQQVLDLVAEVHALRVEVDYLKKENQRN